MRQEIIDDVIKYVASDDVIINDVIVYKWRHGVHTMTPSCIRHNLWCHRLIIMFDRFRPITSGIRPFPSSFDKLAQSRGGCEILSYNIRLRSRPVCPLYATIVTQWDVATISEMEPLWSVVDITCSPPNSYLKQNCPQCQLGIFKPYRTFLMSSAVY